MVVDDWWATATITTLELPADEYDWLTDYLKAEDG